MVYFTLLDTTDWKQMQGLTWVAAGTESCRRQACEELRARIAGNKRTRAPWSLHWDQSRRGCRESCHRQPEFRSASPWCSAASRGSSSLPGTAAEITKQLRLETPIRDNVSHDVVFQSAIFGFFGLSRLLIPKLILTIYTHVIFEVVVSKNRERQNSQMQTG